MKITCQTTTNIEKAMNRMKNELESIQRTGAQLRKTKIVDVN